jgi:hypothetical protein
MGVEIDLACGSHRVRLAGRSERDGVHGPWLSTQRWTEVPCGGASELPIEPNARDGNVEIRVSPASRLDIVLLARNDLRACYVDALRKDGAWPGALRLHLQLGVRGDVTRVIAERSDQPESFVSCVKLRLASSQYGSLRSPELLHVDLRFTTD